MLGHIWGWFDDLSFDRETAFGIGFIRSTEYEAWARLNRVRLGITEVKALKALDRAFVAFHSGKDDQPTSGEGLSQSLRALAEENGKIIQPPKAKGAKPNSS